MKVLLCLFLFTSVAFADTITINPGANGTTPTVLNLPLAALGGTPLDGRTIDLTIHFSDEKWIFVNNTSHIALLRIQTNRVGFWPVQNNVEGFGSFLDINGDPFFSAPLTFPGPNNNGGALFGFFVSEPALPFAYYGLRYEFTLPIFPGLQITNGSSLSIQNSALISVPELPTAWLLVVGLLSYGWLRQTLRQDTFGNQTPKTKTPGAQRVATL